MVSLGQVGQFEINSECLRDLIGLVQVHLRNHRSCFAQELSRGITGSLSSRPIPNQQLPELFHQGKQILPRLINEYCSQ